MKYKLTDWEAGQELISAFDKLMEVQNELRESGRVRKANTIKKMAFDIAKIFNKSNSHDFGLPEK